MDLLRSKGLYRIASGQETKLKDEEKATKWENRQDQARGLIGKDAQSGAYSSQPTLTVSFIT